MSAVDLFSGARGWEARRPGTDALGIELDEWAHRTSLVAGQDSICADVAKLDPLAFRGADGLVASPPCQGFSTAGKGRGRGDADVIVRCAHELAAGSDTRAERLAECRDDRSLLVLEPLRWALALRPTWIALEQVPPVLGLWSEFAQILSVFGYHCQVGVLLAEQYGVPQTRKRAFLVARNDRAVSLPAPTHQRYVHPRGREGRRVHPQDVGLLPWVSMAEALGWAEGDVVVSNYGTGGDSSVRGRRSATEPAASVTPKIDRNIVLRQNARANATERRATEPAPAITGGHDVGDRVWALRDAGRAGALRVTPEEAATLQSFPAGWPFQGAKTRVFRQIGNAVPPLLGAAVLREVMR